MPPDRPRPQVKAAGPRQPCRAASCLLALAYGLFGFGYIITATFIVAMVRGSREIAALEPYIWVMFGVSAAPSVAAVDRTRRALGHPPHLRHRAFIEALGVAVSALWLTVGQRDRDLGAGRRHVMGLTALGVMGAREEAAAIRAAASR